MMLRLVLLVGVCLPAMLDACCMPKKFFAIRTNTISGLRSSYVVDFDLQRSAVTPKNHPTSNPKYTIQWIVNDYNSGFSYSMYFDGVCVKGSVEKDYLYYRCQPAGAKILHTDNINSVPTKTYQYKYGKTQVQMTVTNDGKCNPVMRRQDPDAPGLPTKAIKFTNVKVLKNTDQYLKRDFSSCRIG